MANLREFGAEDSERESPILFLLTNFVLKQTGDFVHKMPNIIPTHKMKFCFGA